MKYYVVDLEANGFLDNATQIWCLCAIDQDGKTYEAVGEEQIKSFIRNIPEQTVTIGHNLIGYDNALIGQLYGLSFPNILDTLLLSQMLNPDRAGGHSLASWGEELGASKQEHEEWHVFSEAMLERCKQDVVIGKKLYERLQKEMEGWDWEAAIKLEHAVAKWHALQVKAGMVFAISKYNILLNTLTNTINTLTTTISSTLPYNTVQGKEVSKIVTKNSNYCKSVENYWGCFDVTDVTGPYCTVSFSKIDLKSSKQVKDYLLSIGWKPTEYTEKGSPKLTEDSFASLPEGTPAALLGELRVANHRLSNIEGLRKAVRADGRIPAEAATCASVTGRYQHRVVANLPRVTSPYGYEIRDLFTVEDGNVVVGSDLSQIEARVMGHYLHPYDNGAFVKELFEGDIHQSLADYAGVSRNTAKTIRYAIMYGCAAGNLGAKVGVSKKEGARLHAAFWEANSGLKRLSSDLQRAYTSRGFLKGLDGRKLMIRSEHALLNSLFQSAATVVFKTGLCLINKTLTRKNVYYKQLIAYHDEVQLEVRKGEEEHVGAIVQKCWEQAGEYWNLRVPIVGDVKYGQSWAETH